MGPGKENRIMWNYAPRNNKKVLDSKCKEAHDDSGQLGRCHYLRQGGSPNPKIACTQNMPPSELANYVFAPPLGSRALKLMRGEAKFQCTGFEGGGKNVVRNFWGKHVLNAHDFQICNNPPPVNNDSSLTMPGLWYACRMTEQAFFLANIGTRDG